MISVLIGRRVSIRETARSVSSITVTTAHLNFLLNSRTLIIGGSSGIGFAVASASLSNGSKVHITSTTAKKTL
ncbi:hypothetical protein K438DRAFT_1852110 [Mycena galopus ATCC 62051]|nr:hypothetical protein K438DRAFT_1852110 [Mycena galopus ATCC 62051]